MKSKVLTDLQEKVLVTLFDNGLGERGYYLTGGTALSEFYLQHRHSDDLDFFTRNQHDMERDFEAFQNVLTSSGFEITQENLRPEQAIFFLRPTGQATDPLKIEFARDVPTRMAPPHVVGKIVVDSFEDIAVNKVCAILNRDPPEPKDFADLFFILAESSYSVDYLLSRAREKEAFLDQEEGVLTFATNLLAVDRFEMLPRMLKPLSLETLRARILPVADDILRRLRPRGE